MTSNALRKCSLIHGLRSQGPARYPTSAGRLRGMIDNAQSADLLLLAAASSSSTYNHSFTINNHSLATGTAGLASESSIVSHLKLRLESYSLR